MWKNFPVFSSKVNLIYSLLILNHFFSYKLFFKFKLKKKTTPQGSGSFFDLLICNNFFKTFSRLQKYLPSVKNCYSNTMHEVKGAIGGHWMLLEPVIEHHVNYDIKK